MGKIVDELGLPITKSKYELITEWIDQFPCSKIFESKGDICIHCVISTDDIIKLINRKIRKHNK